MKNTLIPFRLLLVAFMSTSLLAGTPASSQTQEWLQTFNGSANQYDEATTMAVDNAGNVYIAGVTNDEYAYGTKGVMLLAKYNAAGVFQWSQTVAGQGQNAIVNAIAIDGNNEIIITGTSGISPSGWIEPGDYYTVKFDANGQLLWTQIYNGPSNGHDEVRSIAVDAANNIYITGSSNQPNSFYNDIATVMYSAAGIQQWVHQYNGPGNGDDFGAKAVFKNGFLYVTGASRGTSNWDILTIKYNPANGSVVWTARYDDSGNYSEYAVDMAVDGNDNVYVAGVVYTKGKKVVQSETNANWVLLKYNTSGSQQWVKTYDGSADDNYFYNTTIFYNDYPTALALDNAGNIFVTGRTYNKAGSGKNVTNSLDMTTVKYNPAGTQLWVKDYDGPSKAEDCANAISTDGAGNVYITGKSFTTGQGMNAATVKYNGLGVQQWVTTYNSGGSNMDEAKAIKVDGNGKVYVAGKAGADAFVVKYGQPVGSFRLTAQTEKSQNLLAYPNPVKDWLIIKNINENPIGQVLLFDPIGRKVFEQNISESNTRINLQDLPVGIYYLRIEHQNEVVKIQKEK